MINGSYRGGYWFFCLSLISRKEQVPVFEDEYRIWTTLNLLGAIALTSMTDCAVGNSSLVSNIKYFCSWTGIETSTYTHSTVHTQDHTLNLIRWFAFLSYYIFETCLRPGIKIFKLWCLLIYLFTSKAYIKFHCLNVRKLTVSLKISLLK